MAQHGRILRRISGFGLGPGVWRAGPESLRKVNNWWDSPQKCRNSKALQSHSVTRRQLSGLHAHARKTRKPTDTQPWPVDLERILWFCSLHTVHMASTCSPFASKWFYWPSDPPAVLSLPPVTEGEQSCDSPPSTGNQWKKQRDKCRGCLLKRCTIHPNHSCCIEN